MKALTFRPLLRTWLTSATFLGLCLGVTPVSAAEQTANAYPECTRAPTDGDVQAAKGAFQAGQASFKEADYPRAILYWEDAYRRDCTAHPLLLNLATAYELSGSKAAAISALQTYLLRRSDAPDADQITRRIEVLKRQLEEAERAAQPQPEAAPPPIAAPVPVAPVDDGEHAKDSESKRPVLPLIVAGAGGAVALVGVVVWGSAGKDIKDLEKQCPTRMYCSSQVTTDGNAARGRQTLGGVTALAGLAIAAGGAAWYFLAPESDPQARTTWVAPVVLPSFAGAILSAQF